MIEVTVPVRTSNPLNQSQGASLNAVRAAARRRKTQRYVAGLTVRAELNRHRSLPAPWTIALTRIAPSKGLDSDGLHAALKSVRDGIADALGYSDDSDPAFAWQYDQRRGKRGEYAVHVRIESVMLESAKASNVAACAVCGRELVFYTLRMEPRAAPEGSVWCQEHDPKWREERVKLPTASPASRARVNTQTKSQMKG